MKMPVTSSGFEPAPAGNHLAICIAVVDMGTHLETFENRTSKKHSIRIGWELCHEPMDDGRPYTVNKWYTLSSHEKSTLRKDLESWRGRPFTPEQFGPDADFDIESIIDKPCFLSIIEKVTGEGTKVGNVSAIPKGTTVPDRVNETLFFSIEDFSQSAFDRLDEWTQKKLIESDEWAALHGVTTRPEPPQVPSDEQLEDIPF